MATFSVQGPFGVSVTKSIAGRGIAKDNVDQFWISHESIKNERGCYIFAFKAGKGYKPVYVGKATKSFGQEVFATHKLGKYHEGLRDQKKGTPVFFFVSLIKTRGVPSESAINEAESYLIRASLAANPDLLNVQKTKIELWSINGIVRSRQGKPSVAATELRRCIKV